MPNIGINKIGFNKIGTNKIGANKINVDIKRLLSEIDPNDYGDLTAWFDFNDEDTVSLSGSKITEIKDKAITGLDLTQSTDLYRPEYQTINNRKAAFYDGSVGGSGIQNLRHSNVLGSDFFNANEITIFIVSKIVETGLHEQNFISWSNDLSLTLRGASSTSPPDTYYGRFGSNAASKLIIPEVFNNWKLYSLERFSSTLLIRINDIIQRSVVGQSANTTLIKDLILSGGVFSPNYSIYGYIGECLIYSNGVIDENKQIIRNYLYDKWNIS